MNNIEKIIISELNLCVLDESKYLESKYKDLITREIEKEHKVKVLDIYGSPVVRETELIAVNEKGEKVVIPQYEFIEEIIKYKEIQKQNDIHLKINEIEIQPDKWVEFFEKNKIQKYKDLEFRTIRFEGWVPETQIISTDEKSKTQYVRLTVFI
jgi:hypothetical protein